MRKIILWLLVGLVVGAGITYIVVNKMAGQEAKQAVEQLVAENEEIESLEYSDLTVGLLDQGGKIENVRLRLKGIDDPITVDRIEIEDIALQEGRTVKADVRMEGLTLKHDHALLESITPELAAMGYDKVVVDASADYRYNPKERLLELNKIHLSGKEMGTLSMTITLAQVDPALWDVKKENINLGSLLTTFALVSLGPSQIEYKDDTLLKRWMKHQAQKSGQQPEDLVRQWHQEIDQEAGQTDQAIVKEALGAFKRFVTDPDRIEIRISPEKPVALMRFVLESPERILENLQLKVESN